MKNRLFLVGLTGSGKTTLAPLVAARLGWPWLDLDAEIETRTGRSIADLFTANVAAFRQIEAETLAAVAQSEPLVVATGGGAVLRAENRALMHATGTMLALDVAPDVAIERVSGRGAVPPVLEGDPVASLAKLRNDRRDFYEEADIVMEANDADPVITARRIIAALAAHGRISADVAPTAIAVPVAQTPYTITVAWGALTRVAEQIAALGLPRRVMLITDATVRALLLDGVTASLTASGITVKTIIVPAGEASKSLSHLSDIYDRLIAIQAERGEAIVALGGGVVGDLAGYAAATYLRGVPLIQVPTTLLAQVDSSIGGKTGINHPRAKNAIGAFYQPRAVLIDPAALLSLDDRFFREGWGEIVKYGMALDADLFAQMEAVGAALLHPTPERLVSIIARCAQIKADIVGQDEREGGPRILLNYGHTIGHALEAVTGYGTLLHGEAVFLGMAAEARIAVALGLLSPAALARQDALAAIFFTAPDLAALDPQDILEATRLDKKARGGRVRWVLPTGIGSTTVRDDVPDALVLDVVRSVLAKR
ncbi:MAG: 3-dehydroquinate synthase [Ktedonobacterales bacterium]|nr:3-dehydroquinate synthase [Ktedonobacterales bacterium]